METNQMIWYLGSKKVKLNFNLKFYFRSEAFYLLKQAFERFISQILHLVDFQG